MTGAVGDAVRYWERRRPVYNLFLAAVAVGWVALTWPHFRVAMTLQSLGQVAILALLANLCYCAAYLVDLPFAWSLSDTASRWLRSALWVAGTVFAILFENYWIADEIYPFVR